MIIPLFATSHEELDILVMDAIKHGFIIMGCVKQRDDGLFEILTLYPDTFDLTELPLGARQIAKESRDYFKPRP